MNDHFERRNGEAFDPSVNKNEDDEESFLELLCLVISTDN